MKYIVAIELNGVIRDINTQILKYYEKGIDPSFDSEEIDSKEDPFKYCKFDSKRARNEFMYIDYPYEIFGCAKPMDKNLPTQINNFLAELTNHEEDDIELMYFSMDEEALTIQSSYFFLSKIGTRVRSVLFPKTVDEVNIASTIVVASSKEVIEKLPEDKFKVLIKNNENADIENKCNLAYDSLSDMLSDKDIITKLCFVHSDDKTEKVNE